MAFIRAGLKGGEVVGRKKEVFYSGWQNNYDNVTILRSPYYNNDTYWGIRAAAAEIMSVQPWIKFGPDIDRDEYRYICVHVHDASANRGINRIYLLAADNSQIEARDIVSAWSSSGSVENRWYVFDLRTASYGEVRYYSVSLGGQCGYSSGQYTDVKIDHIFLTNDEGDLPT